MTQANLTKFSKQGLAAVNVMLFSIFLGGCVFDIPYNDIQLGVIHVEL